MIFRDFSDFSIAGNNWEKKYSFIMKNEKKKKFRTEKNFDGLLPILWTGHAGAQAGAGRTARALQATGARACRADGGRRAGHAAGRAQGARWERHGTGASGNGRAGMRSRRAAWAPGLALGSALGALGPFSLHFDLFFFS